MVLQFKALVCLLRTKRPINGRQEVLERCYLKAGSSSLKGGQQVTLSVQSEKDAQMSEENASIA